MSDKKWDNIGGLPVGEVLETYLVEFGFDGFCNERLDCECHLDKGNSTCSNPQLDCEPAIQYTDGLKPKV